MNKEEIEYCGLKIVVNNETYTEYKGTLEEQIEILQQENKQLKEENEFLKSEIEEGKRIFKKDLEYIDERDEKIDKAIKYLENALYNYILPNGESSDIGYWEDQCKDLLQILKGDE